MGNFCSRFDNQQSHSQSKKAISSIKDIQDSDQLSKELPFTKYKKIRLQKVARRPQQETVQMTIKDRIKQMQQQKSNDDDYYDNRRFKMSNQENFLFYKDTGIDGKRIQCEKNSFFGAFFKSYCCHGDILLVPDDIWLAIQFYMADYIDSNSQKLRSKFVKHEGKQQIVIQQFAYSKQQSQKMQKQWDTFFQQVITQIQQKTLPGTVQSLTCNFSTTDKTYKLISTSIIMASFKRYFDYRRQICGCAINNVYIAGEQQDWKKIKQKLRNLQQYDIDGNLRKYVMHVEKIIDNFIGLYDGRVNLDWWNSIYVKSKQVRQGSLIHQIPSVDGWFLHLLGIYGQATIKDIPKVSVSVPIVLENKVARTKKKLELLTGWVSVSKINEYTYKPDVGVCILQTY